MISYEIQENLLKSAKVSFDQVGDTSEYTINIADNKVTIDLNKTDTIKDVFLKFSSFSDPEALNFMFPNYEYGKAQQHLKKQKEIKEKQDKEEVELLKEKITNLKMLLKEFVADENETIEIEEPIKQSPDETKIFEKSRNENLKKLHKMPPLKRQF